MRHRPRVLWWSMRQRRDQPRLMLPLYHRVRPGRKVRARGLYARRRELPSRLRRERLRARRGRVGRHLCCDRGLHGAVQLRR